jgi:hypothetical protein
VAPRADGQPFSYSAPQSEDHAVRIVFWGRNPARSRSRGSHAHLASPVAATPHTRSMGATAWCYRLVSLDPLHEHIARIAFTLPEARQVALAGGGAMLAHDLVDRPDPGCGPVHPDPSEVMQLADALAVALRAEGAHAKLDRREPGFTRLAVTVSDGRSVGGGGGP